MPDLTALTSELSELARRLGLTIGVAESLTGGCISAAIGEAKDSGDWFRGGIVGYHKDVKHSLLKVPPGPVVSEAAAKAMAETAAKLLQADLVVAATGEGGPHSQTGVDPGTVWFAICNGREVMAEQRTFSGEPATIVDKAVKTAVELLLNQARHWGSSA